MQKATLLAGLKATPGDPVFLQAIGGLLEADHAWADLQALFEQQLSAVPAGTPIEAYANYMLGKAAVELGHPDQALPRLERSLALHPDFPFTHHLLGRCYTQTGRFQEALAAHHRCISLLPDFAWSWLGLGEVQLLMGDPAEAVNSFQRALEHQRQKDASNLNPFMDAIQRAEASLQGQQRRLMAKELWPDRPPLDPDEILAPIDELQLCLHRFRRVLDQAEADQPTRTDSDRST